MNMNPVRRFLALLAALVLMSCVPLTAFAATCTVNGCELTYSSSTSQSPLNTSSGLYSHDSKEKYSASATWDGANERFVLTAGNSTYYTTGGLFGKHHHYVQNYGITLTVSNGTSNALKIQYTVSGTVDSHAAGTYTTTLLSGDAITFSLISKETDKSATTSTTYTGYVTIDSVVALENVNVTFASSTRGSYTYQVSSGDMVTVSKGAAASDPQAMTWGTQVTLTHGSADSGYGFYGWMAGSKLLGIADGTYAIEDDTVIYPVFLSENALAGAAPFKVGNNLYHLWGPAFADAKSSGNTVLVNESYTLPTALEDAGLNAAYTSSDFVSVTNGTVKYTVPYGCKLLVPYGSGDSGSFTSEPTAYISHSESLEMYDGGGMAGRNFAYHTLTVPSGTKIDCSGEINVNGQRQNDSQPYSGVSLGGYGKIALTGSGEQLTINGGAKLYCYGYITGTGMVNIASNGVLHELIQICDWPGGSNASNWTEAATKNTSLFPLSQYYVQNVEADLKINSGATASVEAVLTASGSSQTISAAYVGTNSGLFHLKSGYALRCYDENADRMNYHIYGTVDIGYLEIKKTFLGIEIINLNSSDYVLPLGNNMTVYVEDEAVLNMGKKMALTPGSELVIDGGTLNLSGLIYLVDINDWTNNYFFNRAYFTPNTGFSMDNKTPNTAPLPYVATLNTISPRATAYVRGKDGETQHYYMDAINATESGKLEVNGTLNITGSGSICTTKQTEVIENKDTLTAEDLNKVVTGNGFINYESTPTAGTLSAGYSGTITTITTANGYGNLAGVGTLQPFATGDYYGTGDYWYQHIINTEGGSVTVTSTNGAAGSNLSPLDGRKIQNIVARVANGGSITYTIPEGYGVSIDNVVQNPVDGIYTLSNIAADTTLKLHPHDWTTATCVSKSKCTICGQETGELDTDNHSFTDYQRNDDGSYTAKCDYGCDQTYTITNPTAPVSLAAIQLSAEAEVVLRMKVTTDSSFSGTIVLTEEVNEVAKDENETIYTVTNGVISGVKMETVNGTTRYVLEQGIAAGEMTGDVTIEVFDSNGTRCYVYDYKAEGITPVLTRTVVDYVDLALASDNAELIELVKRMAIYGGYSQQHFGVDTLNLAYSKLTDLTTLKKETEALAADSITDNVTWSEVSAAAVAMLLGGELEEAGATEPEETIPVIEPEETEATEVTEATEPDVTVPAETNIPETTAPTETEPAETETEATTEATIPAETSESESTEPATTGVILEEVREITPNVMNSGAVVEETEPAQTAPPAQNFMLELTAIETEAAAEPTIEETIPTETVAVETVPEEAVMQETAPLETIPEEASEEETVPKMPILFEETLSAKLPSSILLNDGTTVSSLDAFGLEYYKQSVVLDSRIALKTSFRMSSQNLDLSQYTFHLTYAKGGVAVEEPKLLTVTSENVVMDTDDNGTEFYKCVVKIEDIPVAYWDFDYIITVTDASGNSYALQTSVLAWVKECINAYTIGKTTLKQANMAKAMYFYNQAANDYFKK